MKKPLLFIITLLSTGLYAQEHFSGITTSRRTGIINATINPAELVNLEKKYEVSVFSLSANASNNKISFGDLVGGSDNFEDLLFSGNDPVNMRVDVEILGPSFAMKVEKWAFAITTAAKVRANLVDIDTHLGRALTLDPINSTTLTANINSQYNQRATATSWGEIGISAAREIYKDEEHEFSAGVTFKLLFPGAYANMSASKFKGTINANLLTNETILDDAQADLNFAYSGSLADGFDDASNFADFFGGGLNGFSTDIGFNYRWKNTDGTNDEYRLNAGLAFRNMGSMTFKDDKNVSNNYSLNIPNDNNPLDGTNGLDLTQFENADTIQEIETILMQSGYVTLNQTGKNFKAKMPALVSAYADYNITGNWYATAYFQQKLNKDGKDGQIAVQNMLSLTPRFSTGFFEVYAPLASNEISGFTAGIGFRVGGFYIGSGSILSSAISDTNQADAYLGFRFGF